MKDFLSKIGLKGAYAFPGKPGKVSGRGAVGGAGGSAVVGGENGVAIGGAGGSVIVGGDVHGDHFFTEVMILAAHAVSQGSTTVPVSRILGVAVNAGLASIETEDGEVNIVLSQEGEKRWTHSS